MAYAIVSSAEEKWEEESKWRLSLLSDQKTPLEADNEDDDGDDIDEGGKGDDDGDDDDDGDEK